MVRVGYISCLSVVDHQSDYNNVENEKFQVVKTSNRGRTQKAITRKSDGRKSSAPKKLSVLEDEKVGEKKEEARAEKEEERVEEVEVVSPVPDPCGIILEG